MREWTPPVVKESDGAAGFYINLDRSPERRARMEQELARAGMSWVRRFSAVDGAQVAKRPGMRLSAAELGCLSSHLHAIESAVRGRFAFIFEDDVEISPHLPSILHGGQLPALADHDVVFLDCQPDWRFETLARLWRTLEFQCPRPSPGEPRRVRGVEIYGTRGIYCWGMTAYIVTPRGLPSVAKVMRDSLESEDCLPVDILMQRAMEDGRLRGAVLVPFLASPRLESYTRTTVTGRTQYIHNLALLGALRRAFYTEAGPELFEFAEALCKPQEGVTPEMELLARISSHITAVTLRDGQFFPG
ncbi:MAG: glycosyltransferase family 25 protein [Alphaproteobacteria bacterium]|nr:MAG: glycosyltransferase family 25 protein [Alphaproteobacteria bacterium]